MGKIIRIRKGIVQSKMFTAAQVRVYQVLEAEKELEGTMLSYTQIAKRAAISHTSAMRICRELRQMGLINWEIIYQEDGDIDYCLYKLKDYRDWCDDNGIDEIKGFIDIDTDIITSEKINPNELRMLEALLFLGADKQSVRITIRELIPLCAMSVVTVGKTFKLLIEKSIVTKKSDGRYMLKEKIGWKKN